MIRITQYYIFFSWLVKARSGPLTFPRQRITILSFMANQRQAYFFALAAVLSWATVATAFKIGLRYLSFLELLFYAAFVSVLILTTAVFAAGQAAELKKCSRRDLGSSAVLGFLNPFAYYLILFKAYSLLPAQVALPLNYTWAIAIVIFSFLFLKQPITRLRLGAIFISYSGVWIIATQGRINRIGPIDPLGFGLALFSSIVWASYWLINIRDQRPVLIKLLLNSAFGFLYCAVVTFFLHSPLKNPPTLAGLAAAAYVGIFEMGITFVFWLKALKLSRTTAEVSNLIFLSPFLSLIFINYVLGERVQGSSVAGLLLIVAGIVLPQLKKATAGPP